MSSNKNISLSEEVFFICLIEDCQLIGVLKLKTKGNYSLRHPKFKNWMSYCSIHPSKQGNCYSKILINEMFKFLKKGNYDHILISPYEPLGLERLQKTICNLSKVYNDIKFQDAVCE